MILFNADESIKRFMQSETDKQGRNNTKVVRSSSLPICSGERKWGNTGSMIRLMLLLITKAIANSVMLVIALDMIISFDVLRCLECAIIVGSNFASEVLGDW